MLLTLHYHVDATSLLYFFLSFLALILFPLQSETYIYLGQNIIRWTALFSLSYKRSAVNQNYTGHIKIT